MFINRKQMLADIYDAVEKAFNLRFQQNVTVMRSQLTGMQREWERQTIQEVRALQEQYHTIVVEHYTNSLEYHVQQNKRLHERVSNLQQQLDNLENGDKESNE